jgi:ribose transport system permease protein
VRRASEHGALAVVVLVVGVLAALRAPVFLSTNNLLEILRSTSTYFVMGCGATLLMIAGGIDFSVGATFTVGATVACGLMTHGLIWPLAIGMGLVAGAVAGTLGGVLAVFMRVPPMIATLAVFFIATGVINASVKSPIAPLPDEFLSVAQSDFAGVPLLVWYAVIVGLVAWVVLEKTPFGYALRAIGGNRDGARLAGVRVSRIQLLAYAVSGAAAALAGILYASRTSAAVPDAGGYFVTLQVITAVLVGGTSLSGGVGSIGGVALASLLFGEIQNALGVASVDQVWSDVFIGVTLALAVALDHVRRDRRFRAQPIERAEGDVGTRELTRLFASRDRADAQRVVAAVDLERKRIERDLHDGAQQQLVLLGLKLGLARRKIADDPSSAARIHDELRADVDLALRELRELAHGIYPVRLEQEGLRGALSEAAERSAIAVCIDSESVGRYPTEIETAVYFCCREALQNAVKHAGKDVSAIVRLDATESHLTFAVEDDGAGFDPTTDAAGVGIRNMRDRIAAIGGKLEIESAPGQGTRISGRVPIDPPVGRGETAIVEANRRSGGGV